MLRIAALPKPGRIDCTTTETPGFMGATMESRAMPTDRWRLLVRRLWQGMKLVIVLAVIGAAVYWMRFSPVAVTEHRIRRGEIVAEVMGTGTLEARIKSSISPKISGRIKEIFTDQNDRVVADKLLIRLDDAELRQQVQIAQANLATAEAALQRLKADRGSATAIAEQAKKEYDRAKHLLPTKAISQSDFDRSLEAVGIATAGLSRMEAAINEGEKQLVAARETLEYHRARLADTEIAAPFDGLVVRRQRDPGDIVVPGSPALSLISTDELWISAWVDETDMARIQEGQPARVVFRSEPERTYPGKVVRLGRETDRETREFIVDVRVLELPRNWAVGQRAEVYIETARESSALLLPAQYVVWQERTPGVLVNTNGRATWRTLTLGLRSRDKVAVLSGLEADECVVMPADPKTTLSDGQRITVP